MTTKVTERLTPRATGDLPVPIPPETEYSVLVPIIVDRVGINRHLGRGDHLRPRTNKGLPTSVQLVWAAGLRGHFPRTEGSW